MRLQKQKDEELAEREGLAKKTVIQFIWLIFSFGLAYVITELMFNAGILSYNTIYSGLSLTAAQAPQWAIQLAFVFIIVVILQFFMFIGFAFASPEGRRKTGQASMYSRKRDPQDQHFD